MATMAEFRAATEPVLRELLKGTAMRATYRHGHDGPEVRLTVELQASLLARSSYTGEAYDELKREEARALVECMKNNMSEAAHGESHFGDGSLEPWQIREVDR